MTLLFQPATPTPTPWRRPGRVRSRAALGIALALAAAACGPTASSGPGGSPASATVPPVGPGSSPTSAPSNPATAAAGRSGELSRIGSLGVTRAAHSASLLTNGRVLVAGGCTEDSCEGVTATTEILDPSTGVAVPGPDMLEPRVGHAAVTLVDGRILLIGGFGPGSVTRTTEIYDPEAGSFTRGPDLSAARADPAVIALPGGVVLVAGGFDGRASVATVEILDRGADAFRPAASLAVARSSHGAVLLPDGRVLVMGGSTGGQAAQVLASAEVYDPATDRWSATGEMSVSRHKLAAVALADGRVLVIGGSDERDGAGRYRSAELYHPATGIFTATADMASPRYKISTAVVRLPDGRVLVAGGAPAAEVFDPAMERFAVAGGDGNADTSFATAVLDEAGSVLVLGGYDQAIRLTEQVLRFVP